MTKSKSNKKMNVGKKLPRSGGYAAKGNKSPKSSRRSVKSAPHKYLNMHGRKDVSNSTVKNSM